MSNKKANSIATISGVDALYYQQSVSKQDYTIFYTNCTLNNVITFGSFNRLSEDWSKQYTYFELLGIEGKQIAKIGFKNLNSKDGLESIGVQMSTYYMNVHGIEKSYKEVFLELESLGLTLQDTKVSRVDLNTYVYGHDFAYLEYYRFSTLVRSNTKIYSGAKDGLATFYLGNRSNGASAFLRIYDKWQELKDMDKNNEKETLIRYKFKEQLNIDLNEHTPLWNVEFECKRPLLKSYGIHTVEDFLDSANTLHSLTMDRMRLLTKKRVEGEKHTNRIPTAPVWEQIGKEYNFLDSNVPLEKLIPIRYTKDLQWLLNRVTEYKENEANNLTDIQILLEVSSLLKTIAKDKLEKELL